MSKTTKRKHVMKEIEWNDDALPKENQSIVKVLKSKGNNLHEVQSETGDVYLVSMPTKFRRNIWVKRGDYILVEPILEGDKVKAEMVKVMNKDSINFYKQQNLWPKEFEDKLDGQSKSLNSDDLFVNTNRGCVNNDSSDSALHSDCESETDEHADGTYS